MYNEQEHIKNQSIIIPIDSLARYKSFLNLPCVQSSMLQLRPCSELKLKTLYGAYSSQSLIKLQRIIQKHSLQFMQIIAFNTNLSKDNKKQFTVENVLRQYCYFSFEDLLDELHYIREQLRDKLVYKQMLEFIKLMLSKAKHLLYKHCETLVTVLGECLNFYIRRTRSSSDCYDYSVVIGLDQLCISFCSSNEYCENILHTMTNKLKQRCIKDNLDMNQYQLQTFTLETAQNNTFQYLDIPEHLLNAYELKQSLIQERLNSIPNAQQEIFYTHLVVNTLVKYAEDLFYLIEGAIVFLSNLVLQKKQLKSISYDQQFISMKHPLNPKLPIEQTFMNLYCQHFQGLPEDLYKNGLACPYCSQPIIVDEVKCFQRNRNVFQNLLKNNYLNPNGDNVIYYFRDKIFSLATRQKFSNYAHFCEFIKKHCFERDRPDVVMLLENEKISLYSKLWGKKKLFSKDELIVTPVRGKYCRHLEFFQLMRVYEKYLQREENQTSFQCFLCFQPIEYDELMYLHEIKLLIDLAKFNFYPSSQYMLNCYLEVSHDNETVELCCQLQKGYMKKAQPLPIYNTLIDPLTKSQKPLINQKHEQKEQQDHFEYTDQFSYFFFGF